MPVITYHNLQLIRAPYAVQPGDSRGRLHPTRDDFDRTPTQRDRDRVVRSSAFRKLKGKQQVFIDGHGDYLRTRLTHSLEVAQIAHNMARVLQLDEDLAEVCGLAHDIGHACFGHAGETALDECLKPIGGFDHNAQALRALMLIEQTYQDHDGLNLCWETVEGIIKHNGPLPANKRGDTIKDFDAKMSLMLDSYPSLEAQLSAAADDIAYNAHDVDDAHRIGLLKYELIRTLPFYDVALKEIERTMGDESERVRVAQAVREVTGLWIKDVIATTRANIEQVHPQSADDVRNAGRPLGFFSDSTWSQMKLLKKSLMDYVYSTPYVKQFNATGKEIIKDLFNAYVNDPSLLTPKYRYPGQPLLGAGDYIAGMTDRFAIEQHEKICQ